MQNITLNTLNIIRFTFMAIGILLFLVLGDWSLSHMDDESMVRGIPNPEQHMTMDALLPQ